MSRPRKPTSTLKKSGAFAKNPQRGRQRENEPTYTTGVPAAPAWMLPDAREEYERIVEVLTEKQVVTTVDWPVLIAYCQLWGELCMTWQSGERTPASSYAALVSLASRLGLTPADRSKVAAVKADKQESEWAKFLITPSGPSDTLKPS